MLGASSFAATAWVGVSMSEGIEFGWGVFRCVDIENRSLVFPGGFGIVYSC